jgi:cell shape-determining protein MreC
MQQCLSQWPHAFLWRLQLQEGQIQSCPTEKWNERNKVSHSRRKKKKKKVEKERKRKERERGEQENVRRREEGRQAGSNL